VRRVVEIVPDFAPSREVRGPTPAGVAPMPGGGRGGHGGSLPGFAARDTECRRNGLGSAPVVAALEAAGRRRDSADDRFD
jgi:hypothetical protein